MIACMPDTSEKRDGFTVNIPEAFLQTKMPKGEDDVHVILDGRMAELLAKIATKTYQEYVHQRQGQAYIYCRVNAVMYGTLKTALMFWWKLSSSLKQRDYVIHLHDWCVDNKDITGTQCTSV